MPSVFTVCVCARISSPIFPISSTLWAIYHKLDGRALPQLLSYIYIHIFLQKVVCLMVSNGCSETTTTTLRKKLSKNMEKYCVCAGKSGRHVLIGFFVCFFSDPLCACVCACVFSACLQSIKIWVRKKKPKRISSTNVPKRFEWEMESTWVRATRAQARCSSWLAYVLYSMNFCIDIDT